MQLFINFFRLRKSFLLYFWRKIFQDTEFLIAILFSQYVKYFTPLYYCLNGFWGEVQCNSYFCSFIGNVFYFFCLLIRFFSFFDFLQFNFDMPKYKETQFLAFSSGVLWDSWIYGLVLDINLENFMTFFQISLPFLHFLLPFFLPSFPPSFLSFPSRIPLCISYISLLPHSSQTPHSSVFQSLFFSLLFSFSISINISLSAEIFLLYSCLVN